MAKPIKIEILGDASGFSKATDQVERSTGKIGSSVGKMTAVLGGAFAAVQIGQFAKGAIDSASNLQEVMSKTEVVFGSMTDKVVAEADKASRTLGMSKTDYLDYSSSIAAALSAGGMGIEETTAITERAVQNFADMASFHNSTAEDVAASWQSAMRGSYEPVQKYMPFINDEFLKTYGASKGLIDENTKTLDANARAIVLDAIALDESLNPAMNDFEETSGGFANSQRTMGAMWEDLTAKMGTVFLPIASKVMGFVTTTALPAIERFGGFIGDHLVPIIQRVTDAFGDGGLGGAFSEIGGLIEQAWPSIQTAVGKIVDGVLTWIGNAVPPLLAKLQGWGKAFVEWVGPQIPPLLEKLGKLAERVFLWLVEARDKLVTQLGKWGAAFVEWVGPQIPPLLMQLGELLSKLLKWVLDVGLPKLTADLVKWGKAFTEWVAPLIPPLIVEVGKLLARLVRWIATEGLPMIVNKLDEWAKAFRAWIYPMIPPTLVELGKFLGSIVSWVVTDAIPKLVSKLTSMGGDMIQGLIQGLWNKAGNLKDAVTKLITDNVPGPVKSLLGIQSPSKVFFTFGEEVVNGFVMGLEDGTANIYRTIQDIFGGAVDQVGTMIGGLGTLRGNHDAKAELEAAREAQRSLELAGHADKEEIIRAQIRLAQTNDELAISEAYVNRMRQEGLADSYELLTLERDLQKFKDAQREAEKVYQETLTRRPATQEELIAANERVIQAELRMIQTQGSLIKLGQELQTTNDAGSMMFRHLAESVGMTEGRITELTGWLNQHQSTAVDMTMHNAHLAASYDEVAKAIQRANDAAAKQATRATSKPKGDGPGAVGALNRTPRGSSMPVVSSGRAADWAKAAVAQFGGRITSTYRDPRHNAKIGGSPTSYHLDRSNPAADIVTGNMQATFDWLAKNYGSNIREMIYGNKMLKRGRMMAYRRNDHWDHVHVAHSGGRVSENWPTMPGLRTDERPAILQVGEEVIPKNRAGTATMVRNEFHISVMVAPGTDKSEVGREVVETIKAYERRNGSTWRNK